jgi:hypothetical protein
VNTYSKANDVLSIAQNMAFLFDVLEHMREKRHDGEVCGFVYVLMYVFTIILSTLNLRGIQKV